MTFKVGDRVRLAAFVTDVPTLRRIIDELNVSLGPSVDADLATARAYLKLAVERLERDAEDEPPDRPVDRWQARWLRERQKARRKDIRRKHRGSDTAAPADLLGFRQWLSGGLVGVETSDLYGAETMDFRRMLTSRCDRACDIHRQHRSAHPIVGPKGKLL